MNVDNLHDTYIRDESRSVRSVALKHKSMLRHGGRCYGDNARVLGHVVIYLSHTEMRDHISIMHHTHTYDAKKCIRQIPTVSWPLAQLSCERGGS